MSQEIGSYLKRILSEKNMSQKELSKNASVSESTISRLVSGERGKRPSFDIFNRLAQGLNIPVIDLMKHSGWVYDDLLEARGDLGEYKWLKEHQTHPIQAKITNIMQEFIDKNISDKDTKEILKKDLPLFFEKTFIALFSNPLSAPTDSKTLDLLELVVKLPEDAQNSLDSYCRFLAKEHNISYGNSTGEATTTKQQQIQYEK